MAHKHLAALAGAAVIGIIIIMQHATNSAPRGIRNKNPGNIKHGPDNWLGARAVQTDATFVQFTDEKYGIRAMAKILRSYARRGVVDMAGIIETWAPPSENKTLKYIEFVEKETGIFANQRVGEKEYPKIIAAMIKMENGQQPYTMATIEAGVALA